MLDRVRLSGLSKFSSNTSATSGGGGGQTTSTEKVSSDLARDRKTGARTIPCTVLFLNDTQHTFHLDKRAKGGDLLELVFDHLDLQERDYFGLQFVQSRDVVRWVDANKSFRKQWTTVRNTNTNSESIAGPTLEFRVKFFVTDPSRLQEEYTRYQFYLQCKRDIFSGKLTVTLNTACLLASYTVQAECGDFDPLEHTPGYLKSMQLLTEQNEEAERRIMELHKLHRGQLPADAEYNFLEHAKRLEFYGIDFHKANDTNGKEIDLGVCSIGLLVYQHHIRVNTFSWSKMVKVSFKRKEFFIQLRKEPSESYDTMLGFSMGTHKNAKALWKACVEHHSFFRLQRPQRATTRFLPLSLGSKFHYTGRTELQAVEDSKQRNSKMSKVFVRSPSKRALANNAAQSTPPSHLHMNGTSNGTSSDNSAKNQSSLLLKNSGKVTSKQPSIPRKAWETPHSDDEGGFRPTFGASNVDTAMESPPPAYSGENLANSQLDESIVTIRLVADEQGRFGFNVKGGTDLQMPILVSRVVSNTPADKSIPRICEGDQVVLINGRDVSGLTHEQVVELIRNSREYCGELVLAIKTNPTIQYPPDKEEPLYQYVPETDMGLHLRQLDAADAFTQSLLLLSDGLASGSLVAQYEQLYRKNPDLAITEARKVDNLHKNRYRDISPYDCTRVVLLNSDSGDYINANYVNMEIPGGTINRYIATQGPMNSTVTDFWRMVQQESSYLIVMLTTTVERGRPKCHQYWPCPNSGEMQLAEGFSVRCLKEEADVTGSFVFRDILLSDTKTGEKRTVQQMQYLVWPDHGVPSDPNLFIQFTEKVRTARNATLLHEIEDTLRNVRLKNVDENGVDISERRIDDSPGDAPSNTSIHQCISAGNPPIIIHCSAGIGRTGVLILMDTALSLIDIKEPVYPLDIVQTMRDQRACMIQNAGQYRFVCECVYAAYTKTLINSGSQTNDD